MASFNGAIAAAARRWFKRLVPLSVRGRLRARMQRFPPVARVLAAAASYENRPGAVRWGSLRRTAPFSRNWGYERGTPIDRVYIEEFLLRHAADIRGVCLEVLNADYTSRFGEARVSRREVLDIDPANTLATIVADLGEAGSLPAGRFDCVIFTQTLHLIPDMRVALDNVWQAITPGGVLLLTVPALGRHDTRKGSHHDRWRVTTTGLEWLLSGLPAARVVTTTYGNLLSCTAFLYGLAAEELSPEELGLTDRQFPLIVAAQVHKEHIQ
jgi:SAM-dependent methyltransferase